MQRALRLVIDHHIDRVNWVAAKADLVADGFDNGRSAAALQTSFSQSQHVALAWIDGRLVGMSRLLSDGVCNAYLLDLWTQSAVRRRGVATAMVRHLMERVPGQHIGLQTDDAVPLYTELGFTPQPVFMSRIVGSWLDNGSMSWSSAPTETSASTSLSRG